MSSSSTIYAVSTARGRAAIAVIRISGPASARVLQALCGRTPKPRQATLATLRDPATDEPLDQALVLYFKAPASETGEDIAELQVHGGRAVIHAVLAALSAIPGCRPAEPGEFAYRAFINGKMDLTAAEGLADLIDAETEAQRRQAVSPALGSHAALYGEWRTRLIECQALTESAIDFSDEGDVSDQAADMAWERTEALAKEIGSHLAGASRAEIIRSGFHVVIAGPPNAGKSTLLNALAGREAAIVSEEAGTTRDVIEVHLDLSGLAVIVTDTAGIRETQGKIEIEGIRRTYERAQAANLIIWLTDISDRQPPPEKLFSQPLLEVANKTDQHPHLNPCGLAISAATGRGLADLTATIVTQAEQYVGETTELVPTSARQAFHLQEALQQLENYLMQPNKDIELRAEDLRLAADSLGRITGRVDPEDVLDQVFSRFCIGK